RSLRDRPLDGRDRDGDRPGGDYKRGSAVCRRGVDGRRGEAEGGFPPGGLDVRLARRTARRYADRADVRHGRKPADELGWLVQRPSYLRRAGGRCRYGDAGGKRLLGRGVVRRLLRASTDRRLLEDREQ